jgi:hypothetical protein
MLTIHYNGDIKLNFNGPADLAKWFEEKEIAALQAAKKTKAAKEAIRAKGTATAYAEIAALLRSTTIEPTQSH